MPNEMFWAYLAGIIDGEGSLGLYKYKDDRRIRKWYYQIMAYIGNTDERLLDFIKSEIGGSKHQDHPDHYKKHQKRAFRVSIKKMSRLEGVLDKTIPYLIIKKEQAELLLEYIKIQKTKPKTASYNERTHEIYRKLRELNKKGL